MINKIDALKPTKHDSRDFSLGGVFGQIDISEVPSTPFLVNNVLTVRDQGETDYCSAYAACAVSEDQEEIVFIPEYTFFRTKEIMGDFESWGADLRSACKALVRFGSVPNSATTDIPKTRDDVLKLESWEKYVDLAQKYRKETFFSVDGKYDLFDNIRAAMWQNRSERRSILTGCMWSQAWIDAPHGVIPKEVIPGEFGHAFKICGQDSINGELHLVAQLSGGTSVGDQGLYYFPREVVNREITPFGAFMFKDLPRGSAEYHNNAKIAVNAPIGKKAVAYIKYLFKI